MRDEPIFALAKATLGTAIYDKMAISGQALAISQWRSRVGQATGKKPKSEE